MWLISRKHFHKVFTLVLQNMKVASVFSEPDNMVCEQATALKSCQEIFKILKTMSTLVLLMTKLDTIKKN